MDAHRNLGRYRAAGALAGLAAALPVGYIALAEVAYVVGGGDPAWFGFAAWVGEITGAMAVVLIVAAIVVAAGHASGALVIALYGVGIALLFGSTASPDGNVRLPQVGVAAFHLTISVIAIIAGQGLIRQGTAADGRQPASNGRFWDGTGWVEGHPETMP